MRTGGVDEETSTSYVMANNDNLGKMEVDVGHDVDDDVDRNNNNNQSAAGVFVTTPVEESHTRSLVKGLTWRFVASFTTIAIAKIVTGETAAAVQIGVFEFFAKLAIYYLHERIWAKIRI